MRDGAPHQNLLAGALTALLLAAAVVVWRRTAGAFAQLPPAPWAVTATLLTATLTSICWLLLRRPTGGNAASTVLAPIALSVVPLAAGLSLLPAGHVGGVAALATIAILQCASLSLATGGRHASQQIAMQSETPSVECTTQRDLIPVFGTIEEPIEGDVEDCEDIDGDVLQQLTRTRTPTGELIEGAVSVPFIAGQRHATVHVPIHPPLTAPACVECYCLSGEDVRIKVAESRPWGLRIELTRREFTESAVLQIGYAATADLKAAA